VKVRGGHLSERRDKIVFLAHAHLSEKIVRDCHMEELLARGISIEYWDLVELLFGITHEANEITRDFVVQVAGYRELESMLRVLRNQRAKFVLLMAFEGRFSRLFRLLTKYGCRQYYIGWGALPWHIGNPRWRRLLRRALQPFHFISSVASWMQGAILQGLGLIKPIDVVFAAGGVVCRTAKRCRRIIATNSPDYDRYAETLSHSRRAVEEPYCVFLDVYLPYHPDLKIVGIANLDAKRYFASLNRFFSIVESQYDLRVVIAAHPQANYSPGTFDGRTCIQGATALLVRDAEFVIAQYSTSVGFAVLHNKPVLFIITADMNRYQENTLVQYTQGLAQYLGLEVLNVDDTAPSTPIRLAPVKSDRYNLYKYEFLTTPQSEHNTGCEIFVREMVQEQVTVVQ